jgi:hypothetical protein
VVRFATLSVSPAGGRLALRRFELPRPVGPARVPRPACAAESAACACRSSDGWDEPEAARAEARTTRTPAPSTATDAKKRSALWSDWRDMARRCGGFGARPSPFDCPRHPSGSP